MSPPLLLWDYDLVDEDDEEEEEDGFWLFVAKHWLKHVPPRMANPDIFALLQHLMGPPRPAVLTAWARQYGSAHVDKLNDHRCLATACSLHYASNDGCSRNLPVAHWAGMRGQ